MQCSGCGGGTKAKQIQTKKGPATVYECQCGCKNEKGYPLGTFAPRGQRSQPAGAVQSAPQIGTAADMLHELKETKVINLAINSKLTQILEILKREFTVEGPQPPAEDVDNIDEQLEPDSQVPF